jgi:hypothetical protein
MQWVSSGQTDFNYRIFRFFHDAGFPGILEVTEFILTKLILKHFN